MSARTERMSARDLADLEAKRRWLREHYDEEARHQYDTLEGKLRLLATILDNGWIGAADTLQLQCLGVGFGDALVQALGLEWVMVEDEYGRDAALRAEGSSLRLFPLTSIAKRIERGEQVDVHALFEQACAQVQRLAQDADPDR